MLKKLRYLDYYILVPYLLLSAIGVVMVYSASGYWIKTQYHMAENAMMLRQLLFVVIGFFLVAFFYYFKINLFKKKKIQQFFLILIFVMLLFLFVLGRVHPAASVNGATAWIQLGPFNIQPTEFAKLVVILYLAYMFSRRQKHMLEPDFSLRDLAQPLILVALIIILVFFEPDTGGAAIISLITLVMLAASGISLKYGVSWAALLTGLVAAMYYALINVHFPRAMTQSYKFQRLLAAVHPFAMRKLAGNQVVNSLIAISHGGLFGVGLGNSTQKLGYLPEPYTDFILAIIAEELGVIGAVVVIGLIFFLVLRFYLIGVRSTNPYYSLIAYGIGTMMLVQTVFNVGAVAGMIPVTGVTLPFISYGGSSTFVLTAAIGIMLNISASEQKLREKKAGSSNA